MKGSGGVFTVVPPAVSEETVSALEDLLEQARNGRVIGIAWICLQAGSDYEVDVAGEARAVPIHVRGLLGVLDDQLAKIIGSR